MTKKKASLADLQVKKPVLAEVPPPTRDGDAAAVQGNDEARRVASAKKPHISVYLTPEALAQLTKLGYSPPQAEGASPGSLQSAFC